MSTSEWKISPTSETRRRLLNFGLWGFVLAALMEFNYIIVAYLFPKTRKTMETKKRSMKLPLMDFPGGEAVFIRFINKPAFVVRPNLQEVLALSAICTHLGCIVKWKGDVYEFHCPCHAGRFDIRGNVLGGPPPRPLDMYSARIENEYIVVEEY